jgi:hypothetical protein
MPLGHVREGDGLHEDVHLGITVRLLKNRDALVHGVIEDLDLAVLAHRAGAVEHPDEMERLGRHPLA